MPPTTKPRATPEMIQEYKQWRMNGLSQADAAAHIDRSERWGRYIDNKLNIIPQIQEAKYANPDAALRPLKLIELSPIAKDCLEDFGRFRYRYLGRKSSPWQENAADVVKEHLATPYKEFGVINTPPGVGKSTTFTHDIPAWLTARSRTIRGLIGSSTQTTADTYTGRLRNTFGRKVPPQATSEDLALDLAVDAQATMTQDFGIFRPLPSSALPWSRREFTVAQIDDLALGDKEATWTAFGKDAGFLGLRWLFIIWDDIFRRKDMIGVDRATKIQEFRKWWDDEAESRLEPGGLFLLQGQRLGAEDIYHYCINKRTYANDEDVELFELGEEQLPTERKYFHVIYKAHYEDLCVANDHPGLWPTIINDDGEEIPINPHSRKAPAFDPNNIKGSSCLLDPVRLPYRELRTIEKRPLSNYRVVYQQEDSDPEDVLVPPAFIDGGNLAGTDYTGCWDDDRGPGELPAFIKKWEIKTHDRKHHGYIEHVPPKGTTFLSIVTADPSPSKFWSVQWWLYLQSPKTEKLMGQRYLIDIIFQPMGANDLLDYDPVTDEWDGLLVEWAHRANLLGAPIQHFILEVNAAQKFMQQYKFFKQWMNDQQIKMRPHHTHINKLDPKLGVTTIRSQYEYGRVRLPGNREGRETVDPLYQQVTLYPDYLYDDCVMAHWFFEYQLQHLVKQHRRGHSVYKDIPSWLRKEAS